MVKNESSQTRTYSLVTGASQGLGFAFCEVLAKRSYNLIMVSLPGQNLDKQADKLRQLYTVHIIIFETDLTQLKNCENLINTILQEKYTVDVLINNAGIGSNGLFTSFDPQFFEKQIALNCQTPVFLCRLLVPEMQKLKTAYILNVGSLGAFFDMPHKEVYVASKAFLIAFTRSLHVSLKKTSIKVSIVCPGTIDSNDRLIAINKNLKGLAKKSVMQPNEVAEEAINGLFSGKRIFITGLINRFFFRLNRMMPEKIQRYFVDREMQRQESIKQNAV